MNHLDIKIRNERPGDYNAILRLTYEAFLTLNYPGKRRMDEHFLIHLLQNSKYVIPQLCFVAEHEGEIIGHILYTKSSFTRPDKSETDTITFGPLSVLPKHHRHGVGAALVRHSMDKAQEMGFKAILITGVPDYYPKLGFKKASEYGLIIPDFPMPEAFMVYELEQGYLAGGGTYSGWAPEFDAAENDDAGYETFNRNFMKEYYPDQLNLRPFFDNDVPLMARWLYLPHIAPWYEHPEDWLNEIRNRHGEFSFLTHLIAEINGQPIGFCQYYDCYDARELEDWGIPILAPKEVYSIDYLIGEQEYLRRGFGKEMIRQMLEIIRSMGAKKVIVQPDKDNASSNKSLLANGFVWNKNLYMFDLEVSRNG